MSHPDTWPAWTDRAIPYQLGPTPKEPRPIGVYDIMTKPLASRWSPQYAKWLHGGSYVTNCTYPSGAIGCVAPVQDGRWRVVCAKHCGLDPTTTYPSRDQAARAEYQAVRKLHRQAKTKAQTPTPE